ncbi:uncharacterized protein LOC126803736 [Argentina anserina]|uniref:uncharacterized protein LOC126803736 n=1 Tax=Argentina anserina TaxID=57926 RepID=UPI00217676E6|nr:uncharacterized protein LOC126803736 [Potentilla anserina]
MISPVSFAQWRFDLIGELLVAPEQFKYFIMAVDYHTKWIGAEPMTKFATDRVITFLWRCVYCRFGVPETFVTNNSTQFDNDKFRAFAHKNDTTVLYASPVHSQTNGQVKAINKLIKQNLKKRLNEITRLWAQKLPEVLWALRTTPTNATGQSPFLLAFDIEAIIPVKIQVPSKRVEGNDPDMNVTDLQLNMDLLEERRDNTHLWNINGK